MEQKQTVAVGVGAATLGLGGTAIVSALVIAVTSPAATSSVWFWVLFTTGAAVVALSFYPLLGVPLLGFPFWEPRDRPVWHGWLRRQMQLPSPDEPTEEDLVVRVRGNPFLTEMAYTTFARPGVRPILSKGETRTPNRLDIVSPEKRTVRAADLPVTIAGKHSDFTITSIVPGGFLVNEERSSGEGVIVWAYF